MKTHGFLCLGFALSLLCTAPSLFAETSKATPSIRITEGTLVVPTYEPIGREMEPPLFPGSTLTGLYPFPTYLATFHDGDPHPKTYRAVFVENEYLKLTYLPELGGRFFSLYDKVRKKQVFYRNDVIKPTMFNPRLDWPQSGIELTGPYDAHMLTLHGEPFWSHTVLRHADGSVSLMLGEADPVYHMKVNLTATLYPGVAAMQISVFCYNGNNGQMPQMFWTNASFPSTEKTRFIYPMTRTVGHTTGEVSDWPLYNGIDYSWDRNNQHMLGVFGIDAYDNFAGAYQFDHDYGVFRYADRRVVQGMKMWTFGYGPGAKKVQEQYTDHAGPYVEVQSGRHVWDGHYEWIAPHKLEMWSEWWVPVGGIGGVTTMTRDVALNLAVNPPSQPGSTAAHFSLALSATRVLPKASLIVTARSGELLHTSIDLAPGVPVSKEVASIKEEGLKDLRVQVLDAGGKELLDYRRPDENPGRKQYSVLARSLESPPKAPDQMTVEELVEAAEFKWKETDPGAMLDLVAKALRKDPGDSRAHLLLGTYDYTAGKYQDAEAELLQATERDPYADEAWYYLAASELALGKDQKAERNLYAISPQSAYSGNREFLLAELALRGGDRPTAADHFERATMANGYDLNARAMLAVTLRQQGKKAEAQTQLAELLRLDPTNRLVYAERLFLQSDPAAKQELLRLMGDQSQEAMDVANFYADVHLWHEALDVLKLVEGKNGDPWGTSPLFYYTLAYYQKQAGELSADSLRKARAASRIVDRFPYRRESEAPLREAITTDPRDTVARFQLACLLYFLGRPDEAIAQWQEAIAIAPEDFSSRRALGLAYAEEGKTDAAAEQLEKAVNLKPEEPRTLNDLSSLYARAGRFDDQIALLQKALQRSPNDDDLEIALLNAFLIKGRYEDANRIVSTYQFAPRHRSTVLRDEYRNLRYGMGAVAFNKGDYAQALTLFQSAIKPPVSLGVDDFQFQSTPRAYYYIGRTLEAEGRKEEAAKAYQESIRGIELLSGDRDSWNTENFYAVLSLERLGHTQKAEDLIPHFDGFARTEMDSTNPVHRGQARYLLALIAKNAGHQAQARQLINESLQALPDSLPPRYELRGDVIDPFPGKGTN